jgi:hypothetical protein
VFVFVGVVPCGGGVGVVGGLVGWLVVDVRWWCMVVGMVVHSFVRPWRCVSRDLIRGCTTCPPTHPPIHPHKHPPAPTLSICMYVYIHQSIYLYNISISIFINIYISRTCPPRLRTARESPALATKSSLPTSSATTDVQPACRVVFGVVFVWCVGFVLCVCVCVCVFKGMGGGRTGWCCVLCAFHIHTYIHLVCA